LEEGNDRSSAKKKCASQTWSYLKETRFEEEIFILPSAKLINLTQGQSPIKGVAGSGKEKLDLSLRLLGLINALYWNRLAWIDAKEFGIYIIDVNEMVVCCESKVFQRLNDCCNCRRICPKRGIVETKY